MSAVIIGHKLFKSFVYQWHYIRLVHLPTHFVNELMFFLCVTLCTRKSKLTKYLFFCIIFRSHQASKYFHVNRTTYNLSEYSPSLQLPCFTIEYCYRTAYRNNINEVQFKSTHSNHYYIIWYKLHTKNKLMIIKYKYIIINLIYNLLHSSKSNHS